MATRLTRGIYNWAAPLAQLGAPPMLLNRCTRTTRHIAIRTHTTDTRVSIGWAKLKFRIKLLDCNDFICNSRNSVLLRTCNSRSDRSSCNLDALIVSRDYSTLCATNYRSDFILNFDRWNFAHLVIEYAKYKGSFAYPWYVHPPLLRESFMSKVCKTLFARRRDSSRFRSCWICLCIERIIFV